MKKISGYSNGIFYIDTPVKTGFNPKGDFTVPRMNTIWRVLVITGEPADVHHCFHVFALGLHDATANARQKFEQLLKAKRIKLPKVKKEDILLHISERFSGNQIRLTSAYAEYENVKKKKRRIRDEADENKKTG